MSSYTTSNSELLELSPDALTSVLQKLGYEDLLTVSATCRTLHQLSSQDTIWFDLCKQWEGQVDLKAWLPRMKNASSLFRLLLSFDKLVGSWSAQELGPRGGLLYVTWGDVSLTGSRVLPQPAGDLKFTRLFEVVGLSDGSSKVEFITMHTTGNQIRLPGAVVWSSTTQDEFHLEMYGLGEHVGLRGHGEAENVDVIAMRRRLEDDPSNRRADIDGVAIHFGRNLANLMMPEREEDRQHQNNMRAQMQQHLLLHNLALGAEPHPLMMPLPWGPADHGQRETTMGQRAMQYLLGLASFGNNRPTSSGRTGGRHGRGEVWQSAYKRLSIQPAKPGQELAGLWSGIYGPHGLEIVTVSYTNEHIVATKVLGDPNVPCGEVTFKVSIASESFDIPANWQQMAALLPVTSGSNNAVKLAKVYQGQGRIAGFNFQDPEWVSGHLLVDNRGNMSLMWENNLNIQFQRFDLPTLYATQKHREALFQAPGPSELQRP